MKRSSGGRVAGHAIRMRTLADICRIVLDDDVTEAVRDAVFATVQRDKLADAVNAMGRLARHVMAARASLC